MDTAANLPEELLEWLEQRDFYELTPHQQSKVLPLMSMEEYGELRESIVALRRVNTSAIPDRESRKKQLFAHYDAHHPKPKLQLSSGMLWKAASVLLILLSAWQFRRTALLEKELAGLSPAKVPADTVFLTSAPELKVLRDTVFLAAKGDNGKKDQRVSPAPATTRQGVEQALPYTPVNVVPLSEMESGPNRNRSNSIQEDTLIRQFGFVTL